MILGQTSVQAYVELKGVQYLAVVEAEPPHRLTGLRGLPIGSRVHDPRVTHPVPVRTQGEVPAEVADLAEHAFAELGLTALLLAGGDARTPTWVLTRGWADLDRPEPLDSGHQFPVPGATVLVTATAVLELVADGRISLDGRANDQLRGIRLADDTITVRELLSHTAGVDSPTELYANEVPELKDLMDPVIACTGPRGTVDPSNGGCAVLGQLVADVTGLPYAEAAARLVLDPLKLSGLLVPRPRSRHQPAGGHRLSPDPRGQVRAGSGPDPDPAGGGRALVHGGRSRAPGPRVVIAAARGPRARGAHSADQSGPRRQPGRPGLAHQPAR